ncbi:monocarboxylate permease [Dichomitus squalens LYAD-421 SS1]|uniref:Monocarboxylate permease n=1 Tax=Dichomitus squalens (strain LYAD-421) TaxID=732165 RepID=R7SWT1_DICSQ|nr:monocarboxylate permease [Dichomitus squalens LYAD-421 SS1]EJF60629.1 monocarboxylate permease [Dichomitus squalens LYAD-421 SS1]
MVEAEKQGHRKTEVQLGNVNPETAVVDAPATPIAEPELEYVPDGGKQAWTVVLGSTLALFASAGMINAYGTFQDYYESTLLPSSSSASISLIGSLQVFFLYAGGPLTGRIFDAYGTSVLVPLGSVLCVFAMMMVSLTEKDHAYQLFLSQGVLFGLGIALMFNPSVAVVGHWFRRRRATAIGVVLSGGAVGGIVFPILLQHLIPIVGFGWAVRVIGFIIMACFILACLTIKTRLPLSRHVSWRTAIDLHGFKDIRYVLATIAGFLLFYALFIPYFYIQIYASFRGVSPNISNYLLAILNAMNVPSRILPGMLADRFGPLKCFIPASAICTILVLGLWLPSRGAGTIVAFAALYGLFSGAFVSLLATYIATITPREVYGARLGSVYIFIAVATLIGTPTAGALLNITDEEHFNSLIMFTGVLLAAGTVVLIGAAVVGSERAREKLRGRFSRS